MVGLGRRSATLLEPEAANLDSRRKGEAEIEDKLWRDVPDDAIFLYLFAFADVGGGQGEGTCEKEKGKIGNDSHLFQSASFLR